MIAITLKGIFQILTLLCIFGIYCSFSHMDLDSLMLEILKFLNLVQNYFYKRVQFGTIPSKKFRPNEKKRPQTLNTLKQMKIVL